MLVFRCTRKLLDRLGPPVADPPESTTVLGDWYAKPFPVAQRRFLLLVSEKARIAVLMPGKDAARLPELFPDALAVQLERLGVPRELREREIAACRESVVASTVSKSLLGTLNDYAAMAKFRLQQRPSASLEDEALSLSDTPLAPLGYRFASEVALELFGVESGPRRPL